MSKARFNIVGAHHQRQDPPASPATADAGVGLARAADDAQAVDGDAGPVYLVPGLTWADTVDLTPAG